MQTNILFSELTTCEEANLSGGTYGYKKKDEKEDEKEYAKKYGKKDEKDEKDEKGEKYYGYIKLDINALLKSLLSH
ncbi:MAG: hypothetical protein KME55_37450 [Nostoc indistinguendum CM1-VF10]|jgi:hypothetical protein|nr:hypothetical protein [Nostoc indistinguendum CM1-VF10]